MPHALSQYNVLLVADDSRLTPLEAVLSFAGMTVCFAHNAYQADIVSRRKTVDFAVLEQSIGDETIQRIRECLGLHEVPYIVVDSPEQLQQIWSAKRATITDHDAPQVSFSGPLAQDLHTRIDLLPTV